MIKNCEECKMFSKCPAVPSFLGMIKNFAKEENVDLDTLSKKERGAYINTILDEWIKYVKGHVTPSLVTYAREALTR